MKKMVFLIGLVLVLALAIAPKIEIQSGELFSECTIGVNHAEVTTHDSPVLWKVLDTYSDEKTYPEGLCMTVKYYSEDEWSAENNTVAIVYYYEGIEPHKYITGGLNAAGIGGVHADCPPTEDIELPRQSHLLYDILASYSTMGEIQDYLDGIRQDMYQEDDCYAFIDNDDHAFMFELDPSVDEVWEYNTMDEDRIEQGLWGFVVRANEAHRQEDGTDDTSILKRYYNGTENTLGLIAAKELNERSTVQSDSSEVYRLIRQNDIPFPISNGWSRSALAIRGAAQGEDPALATMWALLGNPSFSIAVPTWVAVSDIPEPIGTCAMYNAVQTLFNETSGIKGKQINAEYVQAAVLPAEAHLFDMVNGRILPQWQADGGPPAVEEMTRIEHQMAEDAYSVVSYLAYTGDQNLAPTVDFGEEHLSGMRYEPSADAADEDGIIASYLWNFGDGATSEEDIPVHDFLSPGVYLVSVTVTDDDGVSTTAWRYLTVDGN